MKSADLTPNSSVKSSSTVTSTPNCVESENRGDSYYFPKCRRDANCNCEICIASINATLDLIPQSINRSSFTKISASKPVLPRSPISFDPSGFSSPKSRIRTDKMSKSLNVTERTSPDENEKKNKKGFGKNGTFMGRLILILSFLWAGEHGFSWVLSGVLQPKFSQDRMRNLAEKSILGRDMNESLFFLKKEVSGLVDKDFPNSSYVDSLWKIDQDGLLLNSRCVLYGSLTEEVSIWGWPLQTAGLLTTEFSSRSLTILSGRVTEWRNGGISYLVRKRNSSWVQEKWSASPVQLDPNTWILEYRKRAIMENPRLLSATLKFLKSRLVREVEKIKQEFWLLSAFGSQYSETGHSFKTPT